MSASNRLFHPKNWNPKESQPLVDRLNNFSWRLIASWNHRVLENGIFSPLGLIGLLAKMGFGEDRPEFKELDKVLLGENTESFSLFKNLDSLLETYLENDELLRLNFDTQFYHHEGMKLNDSFLKPALNGQHVNVNELNFGDEDATNIVNQRIQDFLESTSSLAFDFLNGNWAISQLTKWNSSWKVPFDPHQTVRGTFTTSDEKKREVAIKFMRTYGNFEHQEDEDYQYVSIPLGEGLCSLVLIQLPDIHAKIKGFHIDRPKTSMIRLDIPHWEVSQMYDFKEILIDAGLDEAFDLDKADFNHISNDPIWLDQVIQTASILVHEKGIGNPDKTFPYSGPRGESTRNVKVLRFNKPFIFLLKENMTGLILFMGKMMGKN